MTALKHVYSGKVRELYEVSHDRLLVVATDRVSVFDVILPDPIPDKGRVLTALSTFWFDHTASIVANHVISADPTDFPEIAGDVAGRAMLVQAARPVHLECVVRGFLFGSAWKEYQRAGTINGESAPAGLHEGDRLPEPRFTPTTKAEAGHDEPLTLSEARDLVGADLHDRVRDVSIALYESGAAHAHANGLVLADTKFEFGECDGELILIDECMTPDSSRYWPAGWSGDGPPPSFDKQPVRDYMEATGWNKTPPAPSLAAEVIESTRNRYVEVYEMLTGLSFDDWYSDDDA
ncbi:MAG TPA: phosphoribosylaminoimidazolesuccinocarboxamide synthase [Acidimicrobiia bacterium]|jgi:phosphoribosylaminoimidazole-succinocarboxamide synthase